MFANSLVNRCRLVGKYLCNLQQNTVLYAAPDQIKVKMLELSIRRCQSNFSSLYFLLTAKKKTFIMIFNRTGWFWQPLNFASAASVCSSVKRIIFFGAFSFFESGAITKHLTGRKINLLYQ